MSVSIYQVLREFKVRQYFIDGNVEPTTEEEFNSTFRTVMLGLMIMEYQLNIAIHQTFLLHGNKLLIRKQN